MKKGKQIISFQQGDQQSVHTVCLRKSAQAIMRKLFQIAACLKVVLLVLFGFSNHRDHFL